MCIGAVLLLLYQLPKVPTIKALYPACWRDTVRYVPTLLREEACEAGQVGINMPVAAPVVTWVIFGLFAAGGIGLWRTRRWPWLAAGMLPGLALMGLPPASVGPVPAYVGKALCFWSMAVTMVYFARLFPNTPPAPEAAPSA